MVIYRISRLDDANGEGNGKVKDASLPAAVLAHIEKKRSEKERAASRAAYSLLSALIGDKIEGLTFGKNGKPQLRAGDGFVSVSHSGDYVAAAFADVPLGIDVETGENLTPETALRLSRRYLFSEYATAVENAGNGNAWAFGEKTIENAKGFALRNVFVAAFLYYHTRYEAAAKVHGDGLAALARKPLPAYRYLTPESPVPAALAIEE